LNEQKFCHNCGFDLSNVGNAEPTELKKMIDFALKAHPPEASPPVVTPKAKNESVTQHGETAKKKTDRPTSESPPDKNANLASSHKWRSDDYPAGEHRWRSINSTLAPEKYRKWGWGWFIPFLLFLSIGIEMKHYRMYGILLPLTLITLVLLVYFLFRNKLLKQIQKQWIRSALSGVATYIVGLIIIYFVSSIAPSSTDQNLANTYEGDKSPDSDFTDGFTSRYSCDGTGKAKGVRFHIDYPRSWSSQEGNAPMTVRTFQSENGRGQEVVTLVVTVPPANLGERAKNLMSLDSLKEMIPPDATYIDGGLIQIDNRPSFFIKYGMTVRLLDHMVYIRAIDFIVFYASTMVQVNCGVGIDHEDPQQLEQRFQKFEPLFRQIANSLVIQSQ